MTKTIVRNVAINVSSRSMISLSWFDADDYRYHIWADRDGTFNNPQTLFKNRDNGSLKTYDPGYYRCHHLNVNAKANAAMIAEAKRIAEQADMLKLADATFAAKETAEQAERIERIRKATRAKELFAEMAALIGPNDVGMRLSQDDMACLLFYRPTEAKLNAPI